VLLIRCPHCGPRNASEFHHAGEVGPQPDPRSAGAVEWRDYLYTRRNPAGRTTERWFHRAGCRRFLTVVRDTCTNEIHAVAPADEPSTPGAAPGLGPGGVSS
jgi:heterotetrameric sarcosine oxidase delta subunit